MTPRSPTSTENWLRCPVFASLRREGWEPRGLWTPTKALGAAVHEGLAAHYRRLRGDTGLPQPREVLQEALRRDFRENGAHTLDALEKMALRGLQEALGDKVGEQGDVLMVDEALPSRARPDLVQRIPGQGLVVTDTKTTTSGYTTQRITDYDTAHQLWHYAWEVGQVLEEPVSWVRVHLVTLSPRVTTLLHPIKVTSARLAFWLRGAHDAWARMEVEQDPAPNWTACVGRYGRCEYQEACHVLQLDPDQMTVAYERTPRDAERA